MASPKITLSNEWVDGNPFARVLKRDGKRIGIWFHPRGNRDVRYHARLDGDESLRGVRAQSREEFLRLIDERYVTLRP